MNSIIKKIDPLRISSIIIATSIAYYIIPKIICGYKIPLILEFNKIISDKICKVEILYKFKINKSDKEFKILNKKDLIINKVEISSSRTDNFNFDNIIYKMQKNHFINNKCELYSKGTFLDYYQIVSKKIDAIYQEFDHNFQIKEYDNESFLNILEKLDDLSN